MLSDNSDITQRLDKILAALGASGTVDADLDTLDADLKTIDGHVDGLETLVAATNTALGTGGTLHADLATTLAGKLDTLINQTKGFGDKLRVCQAGLNTAPPAAQNCHGISVSVEGARIAWLGACETAVIVDSGFATPASWTCSAGDTTVHDSVADWTAASNATVTQAAGSLIGGSLYYVVVNVLTATAGSLKVKLNTATSVMTINATGYWNEFLTCNGTDGTTYAAQLAATGFTGTVGDFWCYRVVEGLSAFEIHEMEAVLVLAATTDGLTISTSRLCTYWRHH
jgi:hypothetical protein